MIKLIENFYDVNNNSAYVKLATDEGHFEGYAFLHPEDAEYASEFLGFEIAELKATKDYYAKKLNRLRETDLIRNNYCINKKIRLFRLSYKLSKDELEKAIDEILIFDESSTTIENNKIYYSDINGNKYNYNNYYE